MVHGRIDKTIDKIRRGGLPAPTLDTPRLRLGDGTPCSGCNDTIEPTDIECSLDVRGIIPLRFHDVCYQAWATFKR